MSIRISSDEINVGIEQLVKFLEDDRNFGHPEQLSNVDLDNRIRLAVNDGYTFDVKVPIQHEGCYEKFSDRIFQFFTNDCCSAILVTIGLVGNATMMALSATTTLINGTPVTYAIEGFGMLASLLCAGQIFNSIETVERSITLDSRNVEQILGKLDRAKKTTILNRIRHIQVEIIGDKTSAFQIAFNGQPERKVNEFIFEPIDHGTRFIAGN